MDPWLAPSRLSLFVVAASAPSRRTRPGVCVVLCHTIVPRVAVCGVAAKQISSLLRTVESATAVVTDSRSVEMVMKYVGLGGWGALGDVVM